MKKTVAYANRPPGLEAFSTTERCADLDSLPFLQDFDVLNLHWIADFLDIGRSAAALRGRPVVWTLHDMRPFTGGCHYAAGCRKFTEHCGACPQLGSDDTRDLSFQTWRHSMGVCRELDLRIVAPSEWLAEEAHRSSLFGRFPVRVIHNAHPLDVFRPINKEGVRRALGITDTALVLAFSAQGLGNTRKGWRFLLECLNRLAAGSLKESIHLLLLGRHPPEELLRTGFKTLAPGQLDDPQQTALVYNAADAVLVPSLEDNLPNVICEATGCGVPAVAFAAGGIPEMLRHRETGWLAPVGDVEALVAGVHWVDAARKDPALLLRCRAFALEHWNSADRARDYAELFAEICARPSDRKKD